MIGKRFLDSFLFLKRVVTHVAWREMAPIGLGRAQIALIRELGRTGPATQSTLARATSVDPSAATRAFTGLARLRLIRRERGRTDRRTSQIALTARGRTFVRRIEAVHARIAKRLAVYLDARDVAAIERIASKLAALDEMSQMAHTTPPDGSRSTSTS
jgi:DNA-binding MarR family transcriptional regulator